MNKGAEEALAAVAAKQHGVFDRSQAAAHGLLGAHLRRRVESGLYVPVAPGVLAIAGSPATWLRSVMATCLAGGLGCVASHSTGATLNTLDTFPTPWMRPALIEVTVRRPRNRFDVPALGPGVRVHLTRTLDVEDVTERHGIPCTTAARTILDLLATHDPRAVEHALDAALRDRKTSDDELRAMLARLRKPGRTGGPALAAMLDDRDGEGPNSWLEREFFRLLERAGLPRPVCQHEIERPGGEPAFADYAYPLQKIVVELHGKKGHTTNGDRARDAARANDVTLLGWRVLTVTRDMVRFSPRVVVRHVAGALRGAGQAAS